MKQTICGADCTQCPSREVCPGCAETGGCPFGRPCFVAQYILTGGMEGYQAFKQTLMDGINALNIPGMEPVTELYPLVGHFVNLEYPLPNGETVKLLRDDEMYLGAQVKNRFDEDGKTCFGVVARENFLLVCEYGENCAAPELVAYQRR